MGKHFAKWFYDLQKKKKVFMSYPACSSVLPRYDKIMVLWQPLLNEFCHFLLGDM